MMARNLSRFWGYFLFLGPLFLGMGSQGYSQSIQLNFQQFPESCPGLKDGRVDLRPLGGQAPYAYFWSNGFNGEDPDSLSAGWYTVTVQDFFGLRAVDSVEVFSLPFPGEIIMNEGQQSICLGDTIVLQARSDLISFLWPDSSTGSSFEITQSGSWIVHVSDSTGCLGSDTVVSSFFPVPGPSPIVYPAGPWMLCKGDSLSLDVGGGYFAYRWSHGPATRSVDLTAGGTYAVTVYNGVGCMASSGPIVVTELEPPAVPVINRSNDSLVSSSAFAYQWYENGILIPGANGRRYLPAGDGFFMVAVFDENGCRSFSSVYSYVGLLDRIPELPISFYPQPCQGHLTIHNPQFLSSSLVVELYDLFGRRLRFIELPPSAGEYPFHLAGIGSGSYLIYFKSGRSQLIRKLLVK